MFRLKYLATLLSLLTIISAVKCDEQEKTKCKQKISSELRFCDWKFSLFASKVLPCNAANATEDATGCPKRSHCIENGTINGTLHSYCVCAAEFTVDPDYSSADNKSQYCIEKKSEPHPTPTPTPTTKAPATIATTTLKAETTTAMKTKPSQTTTTSTTTKKPESDDGVKVAPAPEVHHIMGGIFLPIFIVLGFIGGVFAIKKYDLIERAHGYIRNRNQQTRYNGLMENDFDDDPLLI